MTTIVFFTFGSPTYTFIPFPWKETKMFARQVKVQIRKSTNNVTTSKLECQLWSEKNNFSIHFSLIGRAFSMFRQKLDGPNPSELNIKVLVPAPTIYSQPKYCMIQKWEILKKSLIGKMKWEKQKLCLQYKSSIIKWNTKIKVNCKKLSPLRTLDQ